MERQCGTTGPNASCVHKKRGDGGLDDVVWNNMEDFTGIDTCHPAPNDKMKKRQRNQVSIARRTEGY